MGCSRLQGGRGLGLTGGGVMVGEGAGLMVGSASTGTRLVCNQREIEEKKKKIIIISWHQLSLFWPLFVNERFSRGEGEKEMWRAERLFLLLLLILFIDFCPKSCHSASTSWRFVVG